MEIQNFAPQKNDPRLRMYENIRVPPWEQSMHVFLFPSGNFCRLLMTFTNSLEILFVKIDPRHMNIQ